MNLLTTSKAYLPTLFHFTKSIVISPTAATYSAAGHIRRALDAALIHVCAVIDANLHPTDVAGSLGGNDFGLILLVGNDELAQTKTQSLIDAVKAQPFPWQEETLPLEIVAGVATLKNVDTPENAIEAADKELVASLGQTDPGPQEPTAEKA